MRPRYTAVVLLGLLTGGCSWFEREPTEPEYTDEYIRRIDELERSDVGGRTVFSHEERYYRYLLAGLGLLAAQTLLGLTWLRRAP